MGKSKQSQGAAASRGWGSKGEGRFRLIQALDMTAIKATIKLDRRIAGSPDRRIAGSPDRRIAGSPDRPSCVWMVSPSRAILIPA